MPDHIPNPRKVIERVPWTRALRRSFGRTAVLALGVLAVQAGHTVALGAPDPVPGAPGAPVPLPYPIDNPIVASEGTGNLAGFSSVTPTGNYTYRIPIDVPPGRAGMQPSLALSYISGGGNGHLGVGWSLEGLSEIRRCHKTTATEGLPDGVDFDETDAYCLDGQKLRQLNAADVQNGLEGAEYRTERDTFSKVTAHGDSLGSPASFTVQLRNGEVTEYEEVVSPHRFEGGFNDTTPTDQGAVRAVWLISQRRDQSGNKLRYKYEVLPDPITHGVEYRVKSITYTETHDGQEGQRSVEFHYDSDRKDPTFRYESGVRWETNARLDKITLKGPDPVDIHALGEYRLHYDTSPDTARSLLSTVERCDAKDVCLRAKEFRWWQRTTPGQEDPIEFKSAQIVPWDTAATAFPNAIVAADFNGDGLDDILYRVRYGADYQPIFLVLAHATVDGGVSFGAAVQVNNAGHDFSAVVLQLSRPADIDGDGRMELFAAINPNLDYASPFFEPGYVAFSLNTDTMEFETVGDLLPGNLALDVVQMTDVDGDGRIDIFREQPDQTPGSGASDFGEWLLARNLGNTFSAYEPSNLVSVQGQYARAMDIDGDGRGELLPIDPNTVLDGTVDDPVFPGSTVALGVDDQGNLVRDDRWHLQGFNHLELVDLNGDGLKDALYPGGSGTRVRWNLGNGFGPVVPMTSDIVETQSTGVLPELGLRSADFDGDGIEDIISFDNNDIPGDERIRLFRVREGQIIESDLGFAGTAPFLADVENPDGSVSTVEVGWPYGKLADFNGDGLPDVAHAVVETTLDEDGAPHVSFQLRALVQKFAPSDVLREVYDEDAPLATESIFYDQTPVNDSSSCTWPQRCIQKRMQVVTGTYTAAGGDSSATRRKYYSYDDARMDLQGRGFLGFGKVTVFDPQLRAQTITTFDNKTRLGTLYPYAGLPKTIEHIATIFDTPTDDSEPPLPPGDHFARVTTIENFYERVFTNSGVGTYVVHPVGSLIHEYESKVDVASDSLQLLGSPTDTTRNSATTTAYDAYENPTFVTNVTFGGTARYAWIDYENRAEDWILGLPIRSEVLVEDWNGQAPTPRVTTSDYDEQGLLRTVTIEPEHPELKRLTRFIRNPDGLPYHVLVSADGQQRNTFIAYDQAERMFPIATWNDLAHYNRSVYHPGYGVAVVTDDPNQVATEYQYDGFGRVRHVTPAGGTASSISYASTECKLELASTKGLCTSVHDEDGARHVAYSDEYGRTWEAGDSGFDGALVFRRREYNPFGQPVRTTRPFKQSPGPQTEVIFDSLSRPREIHHADLSTTSFAHTMYSRKKTDANHNTSKVTLDLNGRVIESDDPSGPPRTFTYGPFDQIESIDDNLGFTTLLEYDLLGRRTRLDDPDQGVTKFGYTGFGELAYTKHLFEGSETLADLITEFRYDTIGRTQLRRDTVDENPADAIPATTEITEFEYDATPYGLGKLRRTVSPDGVETGHTYDAFGRPKGTEWLIDGTPYRFEQTYNQYGGLDSLRYPEGGAEPFQLDYAYNAAGRLRSIFRHSAPVFPPAKPLWRVLSRNTDDLLTKAEWENEVVERRTYWSLSGRLHTVGVEGSASLLDLTYQYDPVGNVLLRQDSIGQGRTETFEYDDADRLELWTLSQPDQNGNPVDRVTFYSHDDHGNLTGTMVDWLLDEVHTIDPARPHRLSNIHFTQGQGVRTYSHDGLGRQTQDSDGRQIEYTPFDLPRHIAQDGTEATFAYDAFGSRVKKTSSDNDAVTTTITVGGVYERRMRVEVGSIDVQHVFYVQGDDGPVAQVMYDETAQQETTAYLARDGLGSVGAVFDNQGTVLERLYHEPFGKRVGADGTALPSALPASGVAIGFTGQRHDDDLGLIDMHGRVYDPVQKRFLTPDPIVSNPFLSQSYNRYAYVLNNPLRYTDPSGFETEGDRQAFADTGCTAECGMPAPVGLREDHCIVDRPASKSVESSDAAGPTPSAGGATSTTPVVTQPTGPIDPPLPPEMDEPTEADARFQTTMTVQPPKHGGGDLAMSDIARQTNSQTFAAGGIAVPVLGVGILGGGAAGGAGTGATVATSASGVGVASVLAPLTAFLAITFYPRQTIVTDDAERKMLEASQATSAARALELGSALGTVVAPLMSKAASEREGDGTRGKTLEEIAEDYKGKLTPGQIKMLLVKVQKLRADRNIKKDSRKKKRKGE